MEIDQRGEYVAEVVETIQDVLLNKTISIVEKYELHKHPYALAMALNAEAMVNVVGTILGRSFAKMIIDGTKPEAEVIDYLTKVVKDLANGIGVVTTASFKSELAEFSSESKFEDQATSQH